MTITRRLVLCWSGLTSRLMILAEDRGSVAMRPAGREPGVLSGRPCDWGYAVAGEAEEADTDGVVFSRIAWTDTPET